jgi:hypothetical protein
MTGKQKDEFVDFIDDKLGVDYEINETDDDEFYIFLMDLEEDYEYDALRDFENKMNPPSYPIMKFQQSK